MDQFLTTARCIDIDDMEADVFRALLQFIYTDELPEMNKEEVAVISDGPAPACRGGQVQHGEAEDDLRGQVVQAP